MKRAISFFNTENLTSPPFFPMVSLLPQRCMIAIKSRHLRDKFEDAFASCWLYCFHHHRNLAEPENMRRLLREHFDETETDEVLRLAGTKEVKDGLARNTREALDRGAYGAPWFWLTKNDTRDNDGANRGKQEEPLFGSDRWSYMFRFLGVEVEELRIVDRNENMNKNENGKENRAVDKARL